MSRATRASVAVITAALVTACGATQPGGRRANQQDDGSPPPPDRAGGASSSTAAAWSQCRIEDAPIDLWLAAPEGAFIEVDDEVCFAVPFEGATPETAEWLLAFGLIATDDGEAELLAREPDGARLWADHELDLAEITVLGEGSTAIFGTPARWYALRGRADELGMRDIVVARARRGDLWIIALAVTRPGDQARLDSLLGMIPLARLSRQSSAGDLRR